MTSSMGEALAFEWEVDDHPDLLWDIVEGLKADPENSIEDLKEFAERGSRLAMIYLGMIYADGLYGVTKDWPLAEHWLLRSKESESIEGAFRLGKLLEAQDRDAEALEIYEELSDEYYSPAMYALAMNLWRSRDDENTKEKAVKYLEMAEREGHVLAKIFWIKIMIRGHFGFYNRLIGLWCAIISVAPIGRFVSAHPASDQLRA